MICRAAVKIYDKRQDREIIIPCHRHCDAFQILKEFGYKRFTDYEEIAQGFLNEKDEFLTRTEAWVEAKRCMQVLEIDFALPYLYACKELYSEDLW